MATNKKDYSDITLPLEQWNSTTFKTYLAKLNKDKFGMPCVHGYAARENAQITSMCKEYGKEVVKRFLEEGVKEYKGQPAYPTVNWSFLYTYRKATLIPRAVIKSQVLEPTNTSTKELDTESIVSLF